MSFPYRIVVGDDEPALRRTAELLVGSQGYEIRTAAEGFEVLVELRNGLPDALVSDLSMPISRIAELLGRSPLPPIVNKPDRAPVWIPRTPTAILQSLAPSAYALSR
jgi:CheY-like chemotaxis protein